MLWRMPSMAKRVERVAPARRSRCTRSAGMGDELGDHRVVIDRDLAAFVDAGVVADGDAVMRCPSAGGR